jgi:hypothetical protein
MFFPLLTLYLDTALHIGYALATCILLTLMQTIEILEYCKAFLYVHAIYALMSLNCLHHNKSLARKAASVGRFD